MRSASLLFVLTILVTPSYRAVVAADAATCRKLLSVERAIEHDDGESARAAETAYLDCRSEKLPLDIRIAAYTRYGDAKVSAGATQAAIDIYRDALTVLDALNRPALELTLRVLDRLTEMESEAQHSADALSHARRASELRIEKYGENSPDAAIGLARIGLAYVMQKDFASADRYIDDAIRIADNACGPACDALAQAYAVKSTWYGAQGNTAEANRYEQMSIAATPAPNIRRMKE